MHHPAPSPTAPPRTQALLSALLAFLLMLGMAPFMAGPSATARADEPASASIVIHFKDDALETVDFAQYRAPVVQHGEHLQVSVNPAQGSVTYADNLRFAVHTQFAGFQNRQGDITAECTYEPERGIVTLPARYAPELDDLAIIFWLAPTHPAYDLLIASQLDTSGTTVSVNGETLLLASDVPALQGRPSRTDAGASLFAAPFPGSEDTHYQLNPYTHLEGFDRDQTRKQAAFGIPPEVVGSYSFGALFGTHREIHAGTASETDWNAAVLDRSDATFDPLMEEYLASTIAARLGASATFATSKMGVTYCDRCVTLGGSIKDDGYDRVEVPKGKAMARGTCGSSDINNDNGTPVPQASGNNYLSFKGIYHGHQTEYDGWNVFYYKFDTKSGDSGKTFQDIVGYLLIPPKPQGKAQMTKVSSDPSISNANSNYALSNGVFAAFQSRAAAQQACAFAQTKPWTDANAARSWAEAHGDLCFVTAADGSSAVVEGVEPGDYFAVELLAPKGFRLASMYVPFNVHNAESDSDISTVAFEDIPQFGSIDLLKQSNNPALTKNNEAYSLRGATYGVFTDAACLNQYRTFTTSLDRAGDGYARIDRVPLGTYWVKEVGRPDKGYALDPRAYPVMVTNDSVSRVNTEAVSERAKLNPLGILLTKKDAQSQENFAQGAASLGDAHFRISYYDRENGTAESLPKATPRASWVVRTDDTGSFSLDRADQSFTHRDAGGNEQTLPYLVSGDALYQLSDGRFALPLGTYTIQEVKAPEGYLLDATIHVRHIKDADHNDEILETFQAEQGADMITNRVVRADVSFMKRADGAAKLAGIPFKLTSKTTGEWHIIVTDKNGRASTASTMAHPHSARTNGNDAQFTADDGSFAMPLVLDLEALDATAGVWFGLNAEGEPVPTDDGLGALPFDTYELEELCCPANALFQMIHDEVVVDGTDEGRVIDLGTLNNVSASQPAIRTTARDGETGGHEGVPAEQVALIDAVSYQGLLPGTPYRLRAVLMNRNTGEPFKVDDEIFTVEHAFTTEEPSGIVDVELVIPGADLDGVSLVVFESLMYGDMEIALHADIDDEGQTVSYAYPDRPLPLTGGPAPEEPAPTRVLAQTGDRTVATLCIAAVLAVGGTALIIGSFRKRR